MKTSKALCFPLFLLLVFYSSCLKEENPLNEKEFNFKDFKIEVQSSAHYQDFTSSRELFFTSVMNKEFDWIDINSKIEYFAIENYCASNHPELKTIRGWELFSETYCAMNQSMVALLKDFKPLQTLSNHQFENIFSFAPNIESSYLVYNNSTTAQQRAHCVVVAFNAFVDGLNICVEDGSAEERPAECVANAATLASGAYDDCCANGGSGCP